MKKQFNKKKLMTFGLLSLFALALVTAGLVGYLSNKVQADVIVKSPMEQWISESSGSGYTQPSVTFDDIHGGESITFYVKTENHADVEIKGNVNNIVTNWGVACEDFESVILETTSTFTSNNPPTGTKLSQLQGDCQVDGNGLVWTCGPYNLIELPLCFNDDTTDNTVEFSYGATPIIWEAGQVDVTEVVVTFKTDAVGTYAFTSQIVPVTA